MIDYSPTLVSELNTILPVYLEPLGTKKDTPCITYSEISNIDSLMGSCLNYSEISYQLKIWGKSLKEINNKAILIDSKMKELGFRRTFSLDAEEEGLKNKILRYNAIAFERR